MKRIAWALIILAVIAAGSGLAYWFFTNYEKVKKDIDIGFNGEARRNHLLAAQRFFESYDVVVNSTEGVLQLPDTATTIILPTERLQVGVDESNRYLHWVENGGHLVVAATHGYSHEEARQDPLLELLGIKTVVTTDEQGDNEEDIPVEDEEDIGWESAHSRCSDTIVDVDWPGLHEFLVVNMNDRARLQLQKTNYRTTLQLIDEHGVYLLRLKVGKGYFTVLYTAGFMSNAFIGEYDHAAFLWHVAQVGDNRPILLVYSDAMPSLWAWLVQYAWTALLSFTLFLAIWLWYASRRFGPLLPPLAMARRRLLEHIEAAGRFLWKRGQSQRLHKGVHHALMRAVELRHPVWLSLSVNKLHQRLAETSGLPIKQIEQALVYQARNEHEFTKTIQTLEHIRKSL